VTDTRSKNVNSGPMTNAGVRDGDRRKDRQTMDDITGLPVVDLFAGGGGASTGIRMALGRDPDIAVNHNAEAMAMHRANHPGTRHYIEDIWKVDPYEATQGRQVGLMWMSPDCTHHSKARGSAPKSPRIRGLASVAFTWIRTVRPRIIILENVEEFREWGALDKDGKVIRALRGRLFERFVNSLKWWGYHVGYRELTACDYGAPTSRKRLFLIARCDGGPIAWPSKTHGPGTGNPYHTAAECIDWSIPCNSIFDRKKPLAENTMRRIAKGVVKFILNNPDPFIVPAPAASSSAFLSQYHGEKTENEVRGQKIEDPIMVIDGSNRYGLVTAFISKYYTGVVGQAADYPMPTVTAVDHNALVACSLIRQFGTSTGQKADTPMLTVMPHGTGGKTGIVAAFITKYYGSGIGQEVICPMHTSTAKARMGLVTVTVKGEEYAITDICMRMLRPAELFKGQGFPDYYIIDPIYNGKPLTIEAQTLMCGNSVCPPVAAALIKANYCNAENRMVA